jgi:hypothetical protein
MTPSLEQIRTAAYNRWQHRGAGHGWHEADWSEAEQALLFALNYRIEHFWDSAAVLGGFDHRINDAFANSRRVCRFCEQAEPRTTFDARSSILPSTFEFPSHASRELCDECAEGFLATTEEPLTAFFSEVLECATPSSLTLNAYKGLLLAALCVMPASQIECCADAIEWLAGSGEDFEPKTLNVPNPIVHTFRIETGRSWFALASRTDPDALVPAILAFVGHPKFTVEYAIPFCTADDELDGDPLAMPLVPVLDGLSRWPGPVDQQQLSVTEPRKRRRRSTLLIGA